MATVTVQGGTGQPVDTITFTTSDTLALGQSVANAINLLTPDQVQSFNAGGVHTIIGAAPGIVVNGSVATTIVGGGGSESVIAGSGGLTYHSGGNATVVAAGGANSILGAAGTTDDVVTGAGNDFIYLVGSGSVNGGAGANTIVGAMSAGSTASILSYGTDIVSLGAGAATVGVFGTGTEILAGSGSDVISDSGVADTIIGGSGAETIFGGSTNLTFLSTGTTTFIGSSALSGSDTLVGQTNGAETVFGGTSDVIFTNASRLTYVGSAGSATISGGAGADTIFGGSGSNITYFGTSGTAELISGSGNDTINASTSTAGSQFIEGSGSSTLTGGSGNDTFFSGAGNSLITSGAGADAFAYISGQAHGPTVITDFSPSDLVLLVGYNASEASNDVANEVTSGGSTTLTLSDNTKIVFLNVARLYTQAGTNTITSACFRLGTAIATAQGETPVEALRQGDFVRTAAGSLRRVVWIGHRHLSDPGPDQAPVRIRAHSFAAHQPARDLYLSPDHCVFTGGVLIPVHALIDGGAIAPVAVDEVTYFHILLDTHDIILAENLPCESFLDDDDPTRFDSEPPADCKRALPVPCAPIHRQGPLVEQARHSLHTQAALAPICG